jgi:organic hydroperoxide reductase OsmC/OhrA
VSDAYRVQMRTVDRGPTAVGSAGPYTLVADRPVAGGGGGLGFNGGQLLYLSIAACVSNDLYREAATMGIDVHRVVVDVDGDFPGRGSPSTDIVVEVDVEGATSVARLRELLAVVDEVAEIPNSIRGTTPVAIRARSLVGAGGGPDT